MSYPWMINSEIEILTGLVNAESNVLEYGSGGSTAWFSSTCRSVLSIEHDREWHKNTSDRLKSSNNVSLLLVEPSSNWDQKCGLDGSEKEFRDYIRKPLEVNFKPDFVLIDGRARVDCCKFVSSTFPDAVIAFHDYFGRENDRIHDYSKILEYVDIVQSAGTLAVLASKGRNANNG